MKFSLAIEDTPSPLLSPKSPDQKYTCVKYPLNAFLVYQAGPQLGDDSPTRSICLMQRPASDPPASTTNDPEELHPSPTLSSMHGTPPNTPRRFSLCDLNAASSTPLETKRRSDYFSCNTNHHRRNSVALKFERPRSIGK